MYELIWIYIKIRDLNCAQSIYCTNRLRDPVQKCEDLSRPLYHTLSATLIGNCPPASSIALEWNPKFEKNTNWRRKNRKEIKCFQILFFFVPTLSWWWGSCCRPPPSLSPIVSLVALPPLPTPYLNGNGMLSTLCSEDLSTCQRNPIVHWYLQIQIETDNDFELWNLL